MRRGRYDLLAAGTALTLALALGGCGLLFPQRWKTGDDPHGRDLKGRAGLVLAALYRYRGDNGRLPRYLFELTPKYLSTLPDGVKLNYQPDQDRIGFSYDPSWPDSGTVNCTTRIDAVDWDCDGFL